MCVAVARRWHEPDHGIWEERQVPRHHVYSKVMCWAAIDRAVRIAAAWGRPADPGWPGLRDTIAADVLEHGWNEEARAFTAAYDGTDLDAASLHVGLSGLLDPADERFQATVTAVEAELRAGCTVYRYHRDDGLPGQEGGFHLCATWMIEAYLLTGRRADAEELFGQLVDYRRADGAAARGIRPDRRAVARQPPSGLQPPGPHPLRSASRRPVRGRWANGGYQAGPGDQDLRRRSFSCRRAQPRRR